MSISSPDTYLSNVTSVLKKHWPDNRTVNIVCHGHSVPSAYFATPMVDTFNAYPHLMHVGLKHRFPFAVINVIVTAVGGEASIQGSERFEKEVICHRPDVVTLDYGLNDRGAGLEKAKAAWSRMINIALDRGVKIILLTPSPDITQLPAADIHEKKVLQQHADQIRSLAEEYGIGLCDSLSAFEVQQKNGHALSDFLSWSNHPNRKGHEIIAEELLRFFPPW